MNWFGLYKKNNGKAGRLAADDKGNVFSTKEEVETYAKKKKIDCFEIIDSVSWDKKSKKTLANMDLNKK